MASNSTNTNYCAQETLDQRQRREDEARDAHGGPAPGPSVPPSAPSSGAAAAHKNPCVSTRNDSFRFPSPSPTKDWKKKRIATGSTGSAPSAYGRSKSLTFRQHADPIQPPIQPSESDVNTVNDTTGSAPAPPSEYYKFLTKDMRMFFTLVGYTDNDKQNVTYECKFCPGYKTFSSSVSSNSNLTRHYKRLGLLITQFYILVYRYVLY